jgi:hypothetical protein
MCLDCSAIDKIYSEKRTLVRNKHTLRPGLLKFLTNSILITCNTESRVRQFTEKRRAAF